MSGFVIADQTAKAGDKFCRCLENMVWREASSLVTHSHKCREQLNQFEHIWTNAKIKKLNQCDDKCWWVWRKDEWRELHIYINRWIQVTRTSKCFNLPTSNSTVLCDCSCACSWWICEKRKIKPRSPVSFLQRSHVWSGAFSLLHQTWLLPPCHTT